VVKARLPWTCCEWARTSEQYGQRQRLAVTIYRPSGASLLAFHARTALVASRPEAPRSDPGKSTVHGQVPALLVVQAPVYWCWVWYRAWCGHREVRRSAQYGGP